MIETILLLAAVGVSGFMMVTSDWRWRLICLSLMYLISFLFIAQIWPVALAAVKLVSGWVGVALLGSSLLTRDEAFDDKQEISFRFFKLALLSLAWMSILVLVQRLNVWLPIPISYLFSGLVFFLCGLLFLSVHHNIIETIFGLLIILSGFDIIYSSLEGSALVTGIYAVIVLLLSLLARYYLGSFASRSHQ